MKKTQSKSPKCTETTTEKSKKTLAMLTKSHESLSTADNNQLSDTKNLTQVNTQKITTQISKTSDSHPPVTKSTDKISPPRKRSSLFSLQSRLLKLSSSLSQEVPRTVKSSPNKERTGGKGNTAGIG